MDRKRKEARLLYEQYLGKEVIIYYADSWGKNRSLFGVVSRIEGDYIFLTNVNNGVRWEGSINVRNTRINLVSLMQGWNTKQLQKKEEEDKEITDNTSGLWKSLKSLWERLSRMWGR